MNITIWAVRVLQTEAGLVSLCNPGAVQSKQVVVREHLDAVVVPGMTEGKVWVRGCASGSLSLFVHPWVCAFTPSEHWLPVVWSLMTSLLGCHRNTSLRVSGSAVQPCALWLNGGLWKHAGPKIWCVVVTNWGGPERAWAALCFVLHLTCGSWTGSPVDPAHACTEAANEGGKLTS